MQFQTQHTHTYKQPQTQIRHDCHKKNIHPPGATMGVRSRRLASWSDEGPSVCCLLSTAYCLLSVVCSLAVLCLLCYVCCVMSAVLCLLSAACCVVLLWVFADGASHRGMSIIYISAYLCSSLLSGVHCVISAVCLFPCNH
jgi:hypothetical protein